MKHQFILLITALIGLNVFGQNFNSVVTELEGNGYVYSKNVVEETLMVTLYNKDNSFVNTPMIYTETGESPLINSQEIRLEDDEWTRLKCKSIVNNAFSEEEKQNVNNKTICISLYINSTTGKIADVEFSFLTISPFAEIPLSVYREIEVNLKKDVFFIPTETGKKLNYLYLYWMHEVE